MAKPEWGSKRICLSCGARFYDMQRDPVVCPACGTPHDPLVQARPRRARAAAPKLAVVADEPEAVEAATPEDEDLDVDTEADEADEAEATPDDEAEDEDEDEDTDNAIEDVSELGDDDVSDVIETDMDEDEQGR